MKMKFDYRLPATAAMALAISYAPAIAADMVYDAPPAPAEPIYEAAAPLPSWTGVYAGVTLGYGFGKTDVDYMPPSFRADQDGFVGGVFGGAQYQFDSFVVGVETDLGYSWADGTATPGVEVKSGLDGSLRGRLGFAATEDLLIYGTGGLAYGRTKVEDAILGNDTQTRVGWTVGAGADMKLTEMMFGRIEYRYTDLGDKTFNLGGTPVEVDGKQNKIMLGVGIHF